MSDVEDMSCNSPILQGAGWCSDGSCSGNLCLACRPDHSLATHKQAAILSIHIVSNLLFSIILS